MIDNTALLISCLLIVFVAYRAMRLDTLDQRRGLSNRDSAPKRGSTPDKTPEEHRGE